jgi:CRISPR system Cascade subunit CasD
MIAAALGIDRVDQSAHDALDLGYGFAVRLDASGIPLVDYHTAQTVAASAIKKHRPTTRAAMLKCADPETMLSRRWYRQDALVTICLWAHDKAKWQLEEIAAALRQPIYVLYAGRKANVLGLPLSPTIIEADTLEEAFRRHVAIPDDLRELQRGVFPRGSDADRAEISHDACVGFSSGLKELRSEVRRDAGANRLRWQFAERTVEVGIRRISDEDLSNG